MKRNSHKGFTLVEVLIYMAIVALVITTLVRFVLTLSEARNKNYIVQEVQGNTRVALDIIGKQIRAATSIIVASSTFDVHPGILTLHMEDLAKHPTVFSVRPVDGVLVMKQGESATTTITSPAVRVTNLLFTDTTGSSTRQYVQVHMTMSGASSASSDVTFDQSIETVFGSRH